MVEKREFSLRPQPKSSEGVFRVYLTTDDLADLALKPGQFCQLRNSDGVTGIGIAWRSADSGTNKGVVKVSHFLKDTYGFRFQQPILIESGGQWQRVDRVTLRVITNPTESTAPVDAEDRLLAIRWALCRQKIICPSQTFDVSISESPKRHFVVEKVEPACQTGEFSARTVVEFTDTPISRVEEETEKGALPGALEIREDGTGGLSLQIEELNRVLLAFDSDLSSTRSLSRSILLHGPPGVGKTLLLNKFAEASRAITARISRPVSKLAIGNAFKEARENQPSVIILDDLNKHVGSQQQGSSSSDTAASMLAREMDSIRHQRVLVIGATPHLHEVDSSLRVSHRFSREIEIPAPNVQARKDILKALDNGAINSDLLEQIGEDTHGYVGGDLERLMDGAVDLALLRGREEHGNATLEAVTAKDFEDAKRNVRPSAMREVYLETPSVKWSDIGGLEEIKEQLKAVTERSSTKANKQANFGLEPPKGILLYGPPGCSKTLTAKALAGEGRLNFLSVKGAELISKYVGDSERAIRDVFRRARAASPSILFFDEIDSIAPARDSSSHTTGLNVVTTLLTEMDGVEDLKDVLVLAATNNPWIVDQALMRPGRFNKKIYIGPPDDAARRQILEINTRKRPLHKDVDLEALVTGTEGRSGAEIVSICGEAAEFAAADCENPEGIGFIYQEHFEAALRSVPIGITPQQREKYEKWASQGVDVGRFSS